MPYILRIFVKMLVFRETTCNDGERVVILLLRLHARQKLECKMS